MRDVGTAEVASDRASSSHDDGRAGSPRRRRHAAASPRGRGTSARWWWPALAVLSVLTAWPLLAALWQSIFRTSPVLPGGRDLVGISTYVSVLGSASWWSAVGLTLGYVVLTVAAQLTLGSVVAAAVRRVTVAVPVVRAVLAVPLAVLGVGSAALWRAALVDGFGPDWFGYSGDSAAAGVVAAIAADVWRGTALVAVVLVVALERVPGDLWQVVAADGATPWQQWRHVTWPALGPALVLVLAYRGLDALRSLEASLLAEPSTGLRTVPLLVWDTSFSRFETGLAATLGVLLVVLAALVALGSLGVRRLSRLAR